MTTMAMISGEQDMLQASAKDVHLLMFFAGIIMLALVGQAIAVAVAAGLGYKMLRRFETLSKSMEEKTTPILTRTNELLRDLSPKLHTIATNVEQTSYTVRAKTDELGATVSQLNETVAELNGRTLLQVRRADAIVTEALIATEEISQTVQQGIRGPVRQVVAVIAGVQATIETLIKRSPFGRR